MQCLLKFLEWKERGNKWLKFGEEKDFSSKLSLLNHIE